MNFLVIDPLGVRGHISFNSFFLKVFSEIGNVTFATFRDYHGHFNVDNRIEIPRRYVVQKTRFHIGMEQIRFLSFILGEARRKSYDAIIFLSYETLSFYLRWPQHKKVYIFDHNNISNALGSSLKSYLYKHLPRKAIHLCLMDHISMYIQHKCDRASYTIPHPYYHNLPTNKKNKEKKKILKQSTRGRLIIFSPSGRTPSKVSEMLKQFVIEQSGYYLVAKGKIIEKTDNYYLSTFFENYEEIMKSCDIVFIGGLFDYRVSGVAYEALSFGKPIILFDCPFSRELKKAHPYSVFIIKKIDDILCIRADRRKIHNEQLQFLHEHGSDRIRANIIHALTDNFIPYQ